jgi:xylulose-5-phosphate/fructose-6-phosphate phosphoketolase
MTTAVLTREEAKQSAQEKKPRSTKLPLGAEELKKIDAYWRAANYLSVGQIYLYDNPLLKEPLTKAHVKPRLL